MNNSVDEWALVEVHLTLRDPRATTILFYPTEDAALFHATSAPDGAGQRLRAVFRFSELPEWVQHKAASVAILELGDQSVKYVDGVGGKSRTSVWIEYDPNEAGRAFEKLVRENSYARRNRSAEDIRDVS